MNPDDDITITISGDLSHIDNMNTNGSGYTIDISNITYNGWEFLDVDTNDHSFGVIPDINNPSIYTSHEQREQHNRYPALQKAWEDYVNMYNLTQGEPPIVE